jgi:citronellol/citronellal dehydrogenase
MSDKRPSFGFTDDQLATMPLSFRSGLFDGQVVLVSGAGAGIDKAVAYQFGRLGAKARDLRSKSRPVGGDHSRPGRRLGIECLERAMTIRDPEQVSALIDAAWQHYGRLDVLINDAGGPQPSIDYSIKGVRTAAPLGIGSPPSFSCRPPAPCYGFLDPQQASQILAASDRVRPSRLSAGAHRSGGKR